MAKQADRVLALLRSRGDRGLNTVDLTTYPAADGGPPILRLAARIFDLQQQGYRIRSERKMNGTSTYFIDGMAEAVPGGALGGQSPARSGASDSKDPPPVAGDQGQVGSPVLFELVEPPVNAVLTDYDDEAAA